MDKFEYKVYRFSNDHLHEKNLQVELMKTLNKLGSEGWEMVSTEGMLETIAKSGTTQSTEIVVFFKRKIEQISFN